MCELCRMPEGYLEELHAEFIPESDFGSILAKVREQFAEEVEPNIERGSN